MSIQIKRAYDPPGPADGFRVLVDRLWPRGIRRETAAIDAWTKDVAPSDALRRWFGHDPERWDDFAERYRAELAREPARSALEELVAHGRRGNLTLVYGARDTERNNAVVLRDELERRVRRSRASRRAAPAAGLRPARRRGPAPRKGVATRQATAGR